MPCRPPAAFTTLQVFIADDPNRDAPRRTLVTSDGLVCATCHLPQCKPGCPAAAAPPAAAANGGAHGATTPDALIPAAALPQPPRVADEAAFSEGRSSEDSILLGLPSPKDSVLPPLRSHHGLLAGHAANGSADGLSGGSSPTAEPLAKLAKLGAWADAAEGAHEGAAGPAASREPAPTGSWLQHEQQHFQSPAQPAPASGDDGEVGRPVAGEGRLAAALRNLSRGLASEEDGQGAGSPPRQPPLPPPRSAAPAPWEARASPADKHAPTADDEPAVPSAGKSALAKALASISKGLVADGLL
jgi:hypothetical protein